MDTVLHCLGVVATYGGFAAFLYWTFTKDSQKRGRHCRYCRLAIPPGASACPHCTRPLTLWRRFWD